MAGYDVEKVREDFPILKTKVNGKPLAYMDSTATSQKPMQVIDAITDYYRTYNANIHRGVYKISEMATQAYVDSKRKVAGLINAEVPEEIVYVRNTTEAINIVALGWAEQNIRKGDRILITEMEHHSNIVPWQMLAKRKGAILDYVKLDSKHAALDAKSLKDGIDRKPKLVAITAASNVLGTINDIKAIAKSAHRAGAKVLVDAAQSVPHMKVDVRDLDCDFMAFSGHKMLGPAGIGVLYAKERILLDSEPVFGGGDMIKTVDYQSSTWNDLPWKFEAGTPNIEGGIGLGAAVDYINKLGLDNMRKHEIGLIKYALGQLSELKGVTVYGPELKDAERKLGVIAFSVKGIHAHDVAAFLDKDGIAIRAGHHCAMPLVRNVLGENSLSRMSLYLYNTEEEVDRAVAALKKAQKFFGK